VNKTIPYLFQIKGIGSEINGYITVAQSPEISFDVKRVYWTYYTPEDIVRGHHAHKSLQQVIFAINGSIVFNLENRPGEKYRFALDHPSKGLYIPPLYWRTIELSRNAVLLCLASEKYDENDYIRDYDVFKKEK
jgi:dTDP-4-dehydrorhamnose 3,5-epimerase-like enzyme